MATSDYEKSREQEATTDKTGAGLAVVDVLSKAGQEWYSLLSTPATTTVEVVETTTAEENVLTKKYAGIPGYLWALGAGAVAWLAGRDRK